MSLPPTTLLLCRGCVVFSFFFFSSRRRHTRCSRDWSSDVCSSDLVVRQALHSLEGQSLVRYVSPADSRVTKYEHRLQEVFNFYRHEIAILCLLLLRGPQTPGELRSRSERMHSFDDLSAVQSSLQHLMKREPPLVKPLPRQPGTKETRYAHLLSGDVAQAEPEPKVEEAALEPFVDGDRLRQLEEEITGLKNEIADLKLQFTQFKKQFE